MVLGADYFAKRKTVKRSGNAAKGITGGGGAVPGKGLHQNHHRRDRKGGGHRTELVLPCFPSKEALLLELVKRMFSGQFALAGQHSGEQDPVLLYAVETALQLHIAELTEPLRELYVMAYSLPSIAAYLYKSTTKRLQVIFGPYLPEAQPKDFYEMEIASGSIMRGFMSVPCDVYFTMEAKVSRFLDCSLKLYDVPKEKRAAITAAVLQLDLHAMAASIIQKTVQQAEKGFEALTEK